MATTQANLPAISLVAATDLRTHQFKFMKMSGSRGVTITVAGEAALFVLGNAPNAGEAAELYDHGICKVIAGAALATAGTKVMSNASGLAVAATATNHVVGITISTVANANELVEILKIPPTILA